MEINSIVILTLNSPKEKIWGQLLTLHTAGVTVRGIDINSFDDFVRQIINREDNAVGMSTIFFPLHRVERIAADEPSGSLPSLSDRFFQRTGVTVQEYLGINITRM